MPHFITSEEEEELILGEKYYQFDRNLNDSIEYEVLLYNQYFDDEDDDDEFILNGFLDDSFKFVINDWILIEDLTIDCYM